MLSAPDPALLARTEPEKLHGLDDLVDAVKIGLANRSSAVGSRPAGS